MSVACYVGAPGSGKTTLALASYSAVVSPWAEAGELWVPPGAGNLQKAIPFLVRKGMKSFLIDEAEQYFLCDTQLTKGISRLVQQTRHLKLSVGFTSKRPFCIPPAIFGCHDELYLFRLGLARDAACFKQWVQPERLLALPNFRYLKIHRGVLVGEFETQAPIRA